MNFLFETLIVLCFFSVSAEAKLKVDFRISKIHGFYDFLETISGKPHHSALILKAFTESRENTPAIQKLIEELKRSQEAMSGFNFKGFPQSRSAGNDLESLFAIQSMFSENLTDFSHRTLGLLPIADHSKFFRAAAQILPVYEKLIWNDSVKGLKKYRKKLIQVSTKAKLDELFQKAVRFYGADWPESQPFVISLYPIPNGKGGTVAQSIGAAESVGVQVLDQDVEGIFGVVFHELCHSLYSAQPTELQLKLEKLFYSQDSKYAVHAYDLLNEALATALGNGFAYYAATQKMDEHSWYNDPDINGFAKALYGLVESYLKQERTIDENFVKKSSEILETALPGSLYDYKNLFRKVQLFGLGEELRLPLLKQTLRSAYRVSSLSSYSRVEESALKTIQENHQTLLVFFSPSQKNQLDLLAERIPFVRDHLGTLKEKKEDYIFSALDSRGRAFVFIQISSPNDLQRAFELLKKAGRIDPDKMLQVL